MDGPGVDMFLARGWGVVARTKISWVRMAWECGVPGRSSVKASCH